ncbi:MAG: DALR domain-containing protein, partial [Zestosphaera sp.]
IELRKKAEKTREKFDTSMNNDLNTAEAVASYLDLISAINEYTNKRSDIDALTHELVINTLEYMNSVLGFVVRPSKTGELVENLIKLLVDVRSELRKRKMWELSDKIREDLRGLGIELQDTPSGTKWVVRVGK